jgi:beta propeller repeat protein
MKPLNYLLKGEFALFLLVTILAILSLLSYIFIYPSILFIPSGLIYLPYLACIIASLALVLRDSWVQKIPDSYLEFPSTNPFFTIFQLFMIISIFGLVLSIYIFFGKEFGYTKTGLPEIEYWSVLRASVIEEVKYRALLIGLIFLLVSLINKTKERSWIKYLIGGGFKLNFCTFSLILISALIFGYIHVPPWGTDTLYAILYFFWAFAGGLALGFLFLRYGLHASILFHFLINYRGSIELVHRGLLGPRIELALLAIFTIAGAIYLTILIAKGKKKIRISPFAKKAVSFFVFALVVMAILIGYSSFFYKAKEFIICKADGDQERPSIYGDKIIWEDGRDLEKDDIYLYNLTTKETEVICRGNGFQIDAVISQDTVVWEDWREGIKKRAIYAHDLRNETSFVVYTGKESSWVDIDKENIVWSDNKNEDWDIFLYNLSSGEERVICNASGDQYQSKIQGNIVVWKDERNDSPDIWMYDLTTNKEKAICTAEGVQSHPDVYGDIIVWQDKRDRKDFDIYGYDLEKEEEFAICTKYKDQTKPEIYKDMVVWTDSRVGDADIYGYNLSERKEYSICDSVGDQYEPAIYENIVVWQDDRSFWDSDIYASDLNIALEERMF